MKFPEKPVTTHPWLHFEMYESYEFNESAIVRRHEDKHSITLSGLRNIRNLRWAKCFSHGDFLILRQLGMFCGCYLVGLEKVPSRFTRHPALMQGFAAAA
jgi:hypothetical protein